MTYFGNVFGNIVSNVLGGLAGGTAVTTANTKATEFLRSQLNADQFEQFEQTGHFDVRIKDRIYQITPGRKVHALHAKEKPFLCIMPMGHELPNEDVALAQKLLLEADEEKFLKTAIRWAA